MIVGVVKERKNQENRVGMVASGIKTLSDLGAKIWVEEDAGLGSGISNQDYINAGAKIIGDRHEIYAQADMIIKVKEPLKDEIGLYRPGQTLYTYLHLAADKELTIELTKRGTTCIAYETIQLADGSLPLLRPMSEVAGRISVQLGATWLQRDHGGKGVLLGGVPGVRRGRVTIIGAGIVGQNAAKIAVGLGAEVTVLDVSSAKLAYMDDIYDNRITTLSATPSNIEKCVTDADLLIGAVLIPGARSPKLVTRSMLKHMEEGSVLVDVSVDQGGCIETTKPTTYDNPTFIVDGIIHYCVANMPGTVSRTSTMALTNTTLPYAMEMVKKGVVEAVRENPALALGMNAYKGEITCQAVAEAHGLKYKALKSLI
jgi:alanine dehydrogenase